MSDPPTTEDPRRAAIKRIEAKREFRMHVVTYLVVNAFLVVIWAITSRGYFWPIWPMAGWGVGLVLHWWSTFGMKPISEEEIAREVERGDRSA